MEEYNRDGPQTGSNSWIEMIFAMMAGFLIGGSSCLAAAFAFLTTREGAYAVIFLFIAPFVAGLGGALGMWLVRKPRL